MALWCVNLLADASPPEEILKTEIQEEDTITFTYKKPAGYLGGGGPALNHTQKEFVKVRKNMTHFLNFSPVPGEAHGAPLASPIFRSGWNPKYMTNIKR
ncbi:unnamed protein product, partial [marine sediment metagenome]